MKPPLDFVELIARSHFSFLQGASSPDEMVNEARRNGYLGLGLCDLNGLYGVARGYRAAFQTTPFDQSDFLHRSDFRYHVGAELTLPEGNVVLMPTSKKGYSHLCRLISESKQTSPKAYSSLNDSAIFFHNEDLLAFLLPPWNEERLKRYQDKFGDRLYLPLHRDLTWESQQNAAEAFYFEKKGFQIFATQRPLFHDRPRKKLHDLITCLYHQKSKSEAGQILLPNSERCLHPLAELEKLWRDRPDLLAKTKAISDRLQFSMNELRYRYPQANLPKNTTPLEHLTVLCKQGLQKKFPLGASNEIRELVKKELALIADLKYEDYFLTLHEICEFAKSRNILYQGRGSAANSVVCYLIELTAVDPRKISLLFERFISRERSEPPDIDVDFEHERREEVIQHIYQKYGFDRAGMACNVICFRARMALREVCKVFEISSDTVSEMVRWMGREGLRRLQEDPQIFKKWNLSSEVFFEVVDLVQLLRGSPRHLGIHSGGFVISEDSLMNCVPIEKATMEGRSVVQWNKDDVEALGLMKLDLLSLGMLTALQKCLGLLQKSKGIPWKSLDQIPSEDRQTYEMIGRSDTVGVFQIESRAQMSLLPRLKPKTYYDLVIEVAIVRPGPIQGGMIYPYLKRRDGKEKVTYAHPRLEKILGRTLGIPIFQEQIMQMVVSIADFTPGEADQMRRIMSNAWRKKSQMQKVREKLFSGMKKNGIASNYIESIYKTIEGFASYGFPESHAASFALLTYASCYIKCHHPDVFVCAILNSQPLGFYSPRALIADAQRHQVLFAPISVQFSDLDSKIEPETKAVRLGLGLIQGFSKKLLERVVHEREHHGPYQNLNDLTARSKLPPSAVALLASAGALMDLGLSPREALWKIPSLEFDQQSLLFGTSSDVDWTPPKPQEWDELLREYKSMGFSITRHPVQLLRPELHRAQKYVASKDLPRLSDRSRVCFVGLLSLQQKPPTAKGVSFLTLEDEFGFFNVVLMPQIYEKSRLLTQSQSLLEITGRLEKVQGVYNIIASDVRIYLPAGKYNRLSQRP